MKTIVVIFILLQLQVISVKCLENITDSNEFEFEDLFDDVLVAVQSVEIQTLQIQEETSDQNNDVKETEVEDPIISTESAATEEEFYPTTTKSTTKTVFLNQDFTSNDVPSLEREETSNSNKSYKIATNGFTSTTGPATSTLRSVPETSTAATSSSGSWWLSRFWTKTKKFKGRNSVVVTTRPRSTTTTTTTSTVIVTSTIQYLAQEDKQITVVPSTFTETTQTVAFLSKKDEETVTATSVISSSSSTTRSISSSTRTQEEATTWSSRSALQNTETFNHTEVENEMENEMEPAPIQSFVEDNQRSITSKALYLVAVIIPCLLLLLLVVVWLYLRRRSVWGRRREKEMFRAAVVEEEGLMNNITSTATLKTLIPPDLISPGTRQSFIFLMPGQSLPNISMELKGIREVESLDELVVKYDVY